MVRKRVVGFFVGLATVAVLVFPAVAAGDVTCNGQICENCTSAPCDPSYHAHIKDCGSSGLVCNYVCGCIHQE